jgi:adenosylcobyric acid synthase
VHAQAQAKRNQSPVTSHAKNRKRTPAIMLQGTSSNAGKSVLAAALCRIMLHDGVRVAPFKSQNMSLNSYVTLDGGEMGRAQVVQAQACKLDPDVRMNPILLKPSAGVGCQIILRGKPLGMPAVMGYAQKHPEIVAEATACYDDLADEFDAIVLEGAGSPAEVNLKQHDIVNMFMARHAQSPVLIVGDIDRGGVFASLVGTMEIFDPWERDLVGGFLINRFRGDASLLAPATDYLLEKTGKPTLGIIPFIPDLGLPEEDSVGFKSGALDGAVRGDEALDIVVIDLPHISNFTDVDPLRIEEDVHLRIVRRGDPLGAPDAIIIPGSKNVLHDLDYLRRTGLADAITAIAATGGVEIIGICGGFQILGKAIRDPESVESDSGSAQGLGLLDVTTTLAQAKTLRNIRAVHEPSGCEVTGYEIHHGLTQSGAALPLFDSTGALGAKSSHGMTWGTYLHGLFDSDPLRHWFLDHLRVRKGLQPLGHPRSLYDIEHALDRLADAVRAEVDMDRVYELMGL